MLKHTFIHAKNIGSGTEQKLWREGILTWENFIENLNSINLAGQKKNSIEEEINNSQVEIDNSNYIYFKNKFPKKEHWRLYSEFKNSCAFLDIETTGLMHHDKITVIGLYDGSKIKTYVYNKNLEDIKNELKKYRMLVTFNGTCFDLPFIKKIFPDINFNQIHLDMRYFLRRLGLSGGLKAIEYKMNIRRCEETKGLSGWDAVLLWRKYERGDEKALDLLVKYNNEDIVNLKKILDSAYPEVKERMLGT